MHMLNYISFDFHPLVSAVNNVKTVDVSEKHNATVAVVDANRVKNTALFDRQAAA